MRRKIISTFLLMTLVVVTVFSGCTEIDGNNEKEGTNPWSKLKGDIGNSAKIYGNFESYVNFTNIVNYDGSVKEYDNEAKVNFTIYNLINETVILKISVRQFSDYLEFFWSRISISTNGRTYRLLTHSSFDYNDYYDFCEPSNFGDIKVYPLGNITIRLNWKLEKQYPGTFTDGQIYNMRLHIWDGEIWTPVPFEVWT